MCSWSGTALPRAATSRPETRRATRSRSCKGLQAGERVVTEGGHRAGRRHERPRSKALAQARKRARLMDRHWRSIVLARRSRHPRRAVCRDPASRDPVPAHRLSARRRFDRRRRPRPGQMAADITRPAEIATAPGPGRRPDPLDDQPRLGRDRAEFRLGRQHGRGAAGDAGRDGDDPSRSAGRHPVQRAPVGPDRSSRFWASR